MHQLQQIIKTYIYTTPTYDQDSTQGHFLADLNAKLSFS